MTCPTCNGVGTFGADQGQGERRCEACRGVGKALVAGRRIVYWGLPLSVPTIFERKAERLARLALNALMFTIGVLGVFSLLYGAYSAVAEYGFDMERIVFARNSWYLLFWISVIADGYVLYRLEVESSRRAFVASALGKSSKVSLTSLRDLDSVAIDQKQDVSTAMSTHALHAIESAWLLAHRLHHAEVRPIHLFIALLEFQDIRVVLGRLQLTSELLNEKIATVLDAEKIPTGLDTVLSASMHDVLLYAYDEASRTRQPLVDTTELLVVIARTHSNIAEKLYDLEVDLPVLRNVVAWINFQKQFRRDFERHRASASRKPKSHMNRAMTARPTPFLDQIGRDLTHAARNGAFFPLVGRHDEVERVLHVFEEGMGNVLLMGDAGVGKSAVVEGLADLMASEDVPDVIQDMRLVELNIGGLFGSGGNVESAMTTLINEMLAAGNIVLFIDDLSNLLGAGSTASRTMDAAMVLAQELTRGRIRVIATTTRQHYLRYLQNEDAFMRRFQIVEIPEMDDNAAIQTVEAHSTIFEHRHQVLFSYQAVAAAVKLSRRYLHDRFLPDKAMRVAEEAAVNVANAAGTRKLVTADDVAAVISRETHVPVSHVTRDEQQLLLHLEGAMHERMIGQDDAVRMVAESLRRARTELRDERRPIVNLLFLGPTGVGKTELAKTTADVYFGSETHMIRLDMSEYQQQSSINRLIGAPPGYSSSEGGGQLTDAVRQHPFALVLLDEFEKAHPEILNLFLQVMDDGRLSDSQGREVDFTNAMIIATSNAGTSQIQDGIRAGLSLEQIRENLLERELKAVFRPELLNRFDGVIVFKPLEMEEVVKIAGLMFERVARQMEGKGIILRADPESLRELAQAGFDPTLGARPLRRVIQDTVDGGLARMLLEGKIARRDVVTLRTGGVLEVRKASAL